PRDRRVDGGAGHPGRRAERAEQADELLAEAERVGLVEEEGRAEARAERPEEDEARHRPHLPGGEGGAGRAGAGRAPKRGPPWRTDRGETPPPTRTGRGSAPRPASQPPATPT